MKLMLADWSKVAREANDAYDNLTAGLMAKTPEDRLTPLREARLKAEDDWKKLPDPAEMPVREIYEARLYTVLSLTAFLAGLMLLIGFELTAPLQ